MAVALARTATLSSSTNASNIVSGTMDIGVASGDRVVAIAVGAEPSGGTVPQSCTIGGNVTGATTLTTFGIVCARVFYCGMPSAVSTSTTVTVAVTFSGDAAATENQLAAYRLTGASTTLFATSGISDTDADPISSGAFHIPPGAGVIMAYAGAADSGGTRTWGGISEDVDVDAGGFTFGVGTSVTSSTAVTATVSGANNEDAVINWAVFASGSPLSPAVFASAGVGDAIAVGVSAASGVGASAGVATADAVGEFTAPATGGVAAALFIGP